LENNKDYFLDKLKRRMEEGEEHPFQEEDWALLEPRLKKYKRLFLLGRGLIALTLFMGMGALGIWGYHYKALSEKNKAQLMRPNLSREDLSKARISKNSLNPGMDNSKSIHSYSGKKNLVQDSSQKASPSLIKKGSMANQSSQFENLDSREGKSEMVSPIARGLSKNSNPGSEKASYYNIKRKSQENSNLYSKQGHSNQGISGKFGKRIPDNTKAADQSLDPSEYRPVHSYGNRLGKLTRNTVGDRTENLSKDYPIDKNSGNRILEMETEPGLENSAPLTDPNPGSRTIPLLDSLYAISLSSRLPQYSVQGLVGNSGFLFSKRQKREKTRNIPENYWLLRILASPDFNSVNSLNASGVGLNIGLKLSYNLSDRWRVSAGLLYGPKIYEASTQDYQTSTFPKSWVNLSAIDANCKVFDIPLEIGYSFYKKDRSQFYINLGLSTYFMHQETYTIEFPSGTINSKTGLPLSYYTYTIYNQNRNILGVMDLVLDYHYRISDRSSFGLSPYLKIPLSGVGAGSFDLISLGASLSLNFNLGKSH
jgi:hypothetical protein